MVPLEKQYGLLASPNAYFKGHKRGIKEEICEVLQHESLFPCH